MSFTRENENGLRDVYIIRQIELHLKSFFWEPRDKWQKNEYMHGVSLSL